MDCFYSNIKLPLTLVFLLAGMQVWATPPSRVVSLNLCSDELLVVLAPQRIAALSHLSADPRYSQVADWRGPRLRPSAEAVLARQPDLVLAGAFGAQDTLTRLAEQGVPIHRLQAPQSLAAIPPLVRELAALLGAEARGERLIAALEAQVTRPEAASPSPPDAPRALWLGPNGVAPGADTFAADLLRASGWANALDRPGYQPLSLEAALALEPALLLRDGYGQPGFAQAQRQSHHPLWRQWRGQRARVPAHSPCYPPSLAPVLSHLRQLHSPMAGGVSRDE